MPRAATVASVENAITGMPRPRATCPTAWTDCANSGPTMSLGAFVQRLLRRLRGAARRAGVVLHQ